MSRRVGCGLLGLLALSVVLVHCGGIAVTPTDSDNAHSDDGGSTATATGGNAGSKAENGDCVADTFDGGCGGAAGAPLDPYARLRTACGDVNVNRRGNPAPIAFCIR